MLKLTACRLDGCVESRLVFEPLILNEKEIIEFFDDKKSKKILERLKLCDLSGFRGKILLTEEGVVVLAKYAENGNSKVIVLGKFIGKNGEFVVAYEIKGRCFEVYFENGTALRIKLEKVCIRCGFCWAAPIFAIFPALYPEACENEECSTQCMSLKSHASIELHAEKGYR